ncbi:MAG: TonB-dependent receptor domain-containing protein [Planctomycetaceae bacterium]
MAWPRIQLLFAITVAAGVLTQWDLGFATPPSEVAKTSSRDREGVGTAPLVNKWKPRSLATATFDLAVPTVEDKVEKDGVIGPPPLPEPPTVPATVPPATTPSQTPSEPTPPEAAPPRNLPVGTNTDAPMLQESSLFSQLSKAQQRAMQSAAPSASGVAAAEEGSASAVETTKLVRESNSVVSIARARRSAVSMQPVIRGYQQSQIYAQYQGANFVPARVDFDSILSNIDPAVINNLVVIPGPYGVKYGPGLSFIDIVATPTPRYDTPEFHSRTNVLAQSNGHQLYGREQFYGGGPDYGFRFSVGEKVGSDYRSGNDTNIPASYNVRDIDLAVGFDLNELTKLEIEYITQDLTNTEFAGLIFDADFRKTEALSAKLTIDDFASASWLIEAWVNRTDYQGDNLNTSKQSFYRNDRFFNGSVPPNPFPHVSFLGKTTARATNAGFRLAPTWGATGELQVTAGIDFHYVAQQLDEFDIFENKVLQNSLVGYDNFPIPPAQSYDPGAYIELKAPIDEQLTLTTGARIDIVTSDADATHRAVAPDGSIPKLVDVNGVERASYEALLGAPFYQRDVLLAGFVSADYKLSDELQLRAGFGHGERPANATERYAYLPFLTLIQTPSNFALGDPRLKPEKANQFDLALLGNYDDVRFQVSGFASIVMDYITLDPLVLLTGPPGVRYINTNATLVGGEASGEIDLTKNWSPFFNLSYVDGRDQTRDSPLPSIFPFQSRLGLRWHDDSRKKYGVELSARLVASQNHVAAQLSEPTTPGFTTFDLRGYWQYNEHLKLNGGIENLTNRNYLEHLSVHNPAVLEPGTNFFLGVQLDF